VSNTRSRIADLAAQVQMAHADALETAIRVLEQTVHGSVARGVRARAEHLSAVAKGLDMKVRILAKSDPLLGNEELVEAVRAYDAQLDITLTELDQRAKKVQSEVEGYESAGRGMEQIADRYAQLLKKKGELNAEVNRLKGMIKPR
jgi:diphthamide biosynthesis protein 3